MSKCRRTRDLIGSPDRLHRKRPQCVIFNELVRTTRQYGRCVCEIEPAWLLELAPQFFATKGDVTGAIPRARD